MELSWEDIYYSENSCENVYMGTYRAKVFGGWLIRHETLIHGPRKEEYDGWTNCHNSMIFIADPEHEWGTDISHQSLSEVKHE